MAKFQKQVPITPKTDETISPELDVSPLPTSPSGPTRILASEADRQAQKIQDARALPKAPGRMVDFDTLTQWSNLLTDKQRERLCIYIYRHWPEIRIEQIDANREKYIDCLSNIPTLDYMIQTHGGGKYGLFIKDTDTNNTYFEANLEVPYPAYEPKFDIRATDWTSKRNQSWIGRLRSDGRIDSNNQIIDKKTASNTNPSTLDAMALIDKFTHIKDQQIEDLRRNANSKDNSSSMAQIMIEVMKQNDPTKLVALLQSAMPKVQPDNTMATMLPILMKMMEIQSESANRNMTMMIEVMKSNSTNASSGVKDPLAFAERLIEFAGKLGPKDKGEESTTDKIISAAERLGLPLVEVITNAVMARNSAMENKTYVQPKPVTQIPGNVAPINGGAFDPYSNHEAMRQHTNESVKPNPGMPDMTVESVDPQLIQLFRQYTPMLINVINSNIDGASFGDNLEGMLGIQPVSMIISAGADNLIKAASSIPEFWNVVAPTPDRANMMKEWFEDFVNYKQILAMQENTEEKVQ